MKIEVLKPVEIEAAAIRCVLPVRYGEEDIPRDFPGRVGDMLTLTLDLDTRKVRDWPTGWNPGLEVAQCYLKVCDEGKYELLDRDGKVLATHKGYVPGCVPGEYGDYVDLGISPDGAIKGWDPEPAIIEANFFRRGDE